MQLADVTRNITSLLDNETIEKLYLLGIVPCLVEVTRCQVYWHSRVETLSQLRVTFKSTTDWKLTYQLLLRELESDFHPRLWNFEDNVTVSRILLALGHKPRELDMHDAAQFESLNILSFLLKESGSPAISILLGTAIPRGRYQATKMIIDHLHIQGSPIGLGIGLLHQACMLQDARLVRAKILQLLLADNVADPAVVDHTLLYYCATVEIVRVVLADKRIVNPEADNNRALEQAIRRDKIDIVRALLECPAVAANIHQGIRDVARQFGNEEIIKLLS